MPSPIKFAHVVLRTARFDEMIAWWTNVLEADVRFGNDFIAFLSFDDEHHRVAMINAPLEDQEVGRAGVDHVAYTYASVDDQFATYARLKSQGVEPYWMIHHGGTLSAYYRDPVRAELTAQVFAALSGGPAPDPNSIVPMLDEQQRTVLRITPDKTVLHR